MVVRLREKPKLLNIVLRDIIALMRFRFYIPIPSKAKKRIPLPAVEPGALFDEIIRIPNYSDNFPHTPEKLIQPVRTNLKSDSSRPMNSGS